MLTLAQRLITAAAGWNSITGMVATLEGSGASTEVSSSLIRLGASSYLTLIMTNTGGNYAPVVAKISTTSKIGSVVWQRRLALSGSNLYSRGMATDAAGNIYVSAYNASTDTDGSKIIKLNSAGSLQWQRKLYDAALGTSVRAIAVDPAGSVYVAGVIASTPYKTFTAKYNNAGTLQWQRTLSLAGETGMGAESAAVDSVGNVYVLGTCGTTASKKILLAKYNSAGTLQFQKAYYIGASQVAALTIDSSDHLYAAVSLNGGYGAAMKLDTSGTVAWHRYATSAVGTAGIASASDGKVLLLGSSLWVFDSAGSMMHQRALAGTVSGSGTIYQAWMDADTVVLACITGRTSSGLDATLSEFPASGAGLGVYGWITYSETSTAFTSGSLTTETPTLTDAAGTLTDAPGDVTDAAGALAIATYYKA